MRHSREPSRVHAATLALALAYLAGFAGPARASTYVVYVALDDPIYQELDTLNGLGLLQTYLAEIKPISRVEAARLAIEARRLLKDARRDPSRQPIMPLARAVLGSLEDELDEEIEWLENDAEDGQPTMLKPLERIEAQFVYSAGDRRVFGPNQKGEQLHAVEATPLLPNNDNLPTSPGSNEVVRPSGWVGVHGFLSGYAEGALAGPLSRSPEGINGSTYSRFQMLRGEVVADFGNAAFSFGREEMWWGTGHFSSLSQGNNAPPFYALRLQSVHPSYLPGFLRYLGPFRHQEFFGQLDHYRPFNGDPGRAYSRPWLSGQTIAFKPLPTFEIGFTHVVMFGGHNNDNYNFPGFLGRATGLDTGSTSNGNTNTQAGVFAKFYFPRLRNLQLYQEVVGEDNLTNEVPKIGGAVPFAAASFLGGAYLPRLTADGRTTARLEYIDTSQRYAFHSDSLYWTYKDRLMGAPIGPNSFQLTLEIGRWLTRYTELTMGYIHSERDPQDNIEKMPVGDTEHGDGMTVSLMRLPHPLHGFGNRPFDIRSYLALEWVRNLDYEPGVSSTRVAFGMSFGLWPQLPAIIWH